MDREDSAKSLARKTVFPFPIALYESKGVIFELFDGGQPYQNHVIRWERLKTVAVTRNDCEFSVDINQRDSGVFPIF